MRWVTDFTTEKGWGFEIEREAVVTGKKEKEFYRFMLRVFEPLGELNTEYMQEDLIEAQVHALRKWGVPLESWECHL